MWEHADDIGAERARAPKGSRAETPVGDTRTASGVLALQRTAGNKAVAQRLAGEEEAPSVHDIVGRGGGQPLDKGLRSQMEGALGADLSDVRVHTDGDAAKSAQALNAHAYTVGSNVVVQPTHADFSTDTGKRTLAHELTHVVQQRQGPVDGTDIGGGVKVSDPSDRFEQEAERTADLVMSGQSQAPAAGASAGVQRHADEETAQTLAIQREGAEEEEEEVQTLAVQREGAEEEEELQGLWVQREGAEEEEELQTLAIQREAAPEEEEVAM